MYSVNVKRRDLTDFLHVELSLKIHAIDEQMGKKNMVKGGKGYQISDKVDTLKTVAQETNTSHDTVSKVKKILSQGTSQQQDALRENKEGYSINRVYREIKKDEHIRKVKEELGKVQVKLPGTVQLYNEDFRKLKIKDGSVSLIFTDPPYTNEYLPIYEDLSKQAFRVLKQGGSLVCYFAQHHMRKVIEMVEKSGLVFHWPIAVLHSGPTNTLNAYKVFPKYKPMLWFTKGKYEGQFVNDVIKSEFQGKELHEWAQSTVESDYFIKYMTYENEIVYDAFMGQGTFGISAVNQNRQFIGAELDPEKFEIAKKMISKNTGGIK